MYMTRSFSIPQRAPPIHRTPVRVSPSTRPVLFSGGERCERVARALRAGIVWQNCSQPAFVQAPWGGYKQSGFGRELGRWGLEEFLGVKQITSCAGSFSYGWYGK